jgi:hypothetical protein
MTFSQFKIDSFDVIDNNYKKKNHHHYASVESYFIEAIEINNVCKTIDTMIWRHIAVQKESNCKWNKDNDFLLIRILPFYDLKLIDSTKFDLLYSINDLSNKPFEINSDWDYYRIYNADVEFINKDSKNMFSLLNYKKIYLFKHEKCTVLIVSLLPLTFNEIDNIEIKIEDKMEDRENNNKCNLYLKQTFYILNKNTIREVRYKDIINPSWTGKNEMFK